MSLVGLICPTRDILDYKIFTSSLNIRRWLRKWRHTELVALVQSTSWLKKDQLPNSLLCCLLRLHGHFEPHETQCFFSVMFSFSFLLFLSIFRDLRCLSGAITRCGDAINGRFWRLEPWLAAVGLVVEIGKQDDERDGVADQSPLHPGRERAARVERVSGMTNGDVELDLNRCETEICNFKGFFDCFK